MHKACATKYSALYRGAGDLSSAAGVSAVGSDCDAVLGLIEPKLMELSDGEYLSPQEKVFMVYFLCVVFGIYIFRRSFL